MHFEEYKNTVAQIELDDYASLLNVGRKWEKIAPQKSVNIRIGIIGSTSLQLIVSVTRALLTRYDLYADIYEGEYNGIFMDIFDYGSRLYTFAPEYLVILPDYHDIIDSCPAILTEDNEVTACINRVYENYNRFFLTVHERLPKTQIIMGNFVEPYFGPMGNLEINYISSQRMFFKQINLMLTKEHPSYVSLIDVESLAQYIGKKNWFDESSYYINKSGFALPYIGFYCDLIARQFEAFTGRVKKCLILDLDNTLWGGAVGDLGYDGIMLDPNDAEGEAFQAFQRYVRKLKYRGIILAVCSKNDEENAKEPFEKNKNMILRLDDISAFVANWSDKASNIKMIAQELGISTDSMVFFDDNPTERELIREYLPEVKVIEVPDDPALYIRALDQSYAFDWNQLTREDLNRIQTYANRPEQNVLMASCVDYDDYLKKLQMRISFNIVDSKNMTRFVQLTNKSNQFNLRTIRYSEAEIEEMVENPIFELFVISLADKYTNYGVIACVILRIEGEVAFIENWVMSCRVLKKTVENYTVKKIVDEVRNRGCSELRAEYVPTKKNSMVKDLYDKLGFMINGEKGSIKQYVLDRAHMDTFEQKYFFEED